MWTLTIASVVLLHVGYLVFQTLGALLILRHRGWLWAHLGAVTWGVLIVVVQGSCPLTRLEKYLTIRSGETPYTGSFLDHYMFGALLPDGTQSLVYGGHLLVIIATYAYVLTRLQAAAPAPGSVIEDAAELAPGETRPLGPA
jgi:hypothetical protein